MLWSSPVIKYSTETPSKLATFTATSDFGNEPFFQPVIAAPETPTCCAIL